MNEISAGDQDSVRRAMHIAAVTLAGDHDVLLASRELADLRGELPSLPDDALDTFIAVSSEIDDIPLGSQRNLWEPVALRAKDKEAQEYRERISPAVIHSLKRLLLLLSQRSY